jgi:hypothetical protein
MSEPTKQPAECAKSDYRSYVRVGSGKLPPVSHSILLTPIFDIQSLEEQLGAKCQNCNSPN